MNVKTSTLGVLIFGLVALFPTLPVAEANICRDLYSTKTLSEADFATRETENSLDKLLIREVAESVPEMHRARAYVNSRDGRIVKSPVTIVILHGLLNSPAWTDWAARRLHSLGFNVINLRLPNHFSRDRTDLDNFDYQDVFKLMDEVEPIARGLSRSGQIVYMGHSTGGLASIYSALNHSASTAGLVLYSPALGVSRQVKNKSYGLSALKISGWLEDKLKHYSPETADPMTRYQSPMAGVQVDRMAKAVAQAPGEGEPGPYALVKQRLNDLPMFVVNTKIDKTINYELNRDIFSHMANTQQEIFSEKDGIVHNQTMSDPAEAKSETEKHAKEVVTDHMIAFVQQLVERYGSP